MISNYQELKGAIRDYLHRGDLADATSTFIQMAESRLNRSIRVMQMETDATINIVNGEGALPADWIEFVAMPTVGGNALDFVQRDQWGGIYNNSLGGNYYTIVGGKLRATWDGTAGAGPVKIVYYAKIPSLTDTENTNWLLRDAADVYLYASLLEAEPYLKNDKRIDVWRGYLQAALIDMQAANDRAKYSGGSLILGNPITVW